MNVVPFAESGVEYGYAVHSEALALGRFDDSRFDGQPPCPEAFGDAVYAEGDDHAYTSDNPSCVALHDRDALVIKYTATLE